MPTGDDGKRAGLDAARRRMRDRRIAMAAAMSLDDRIRCGSGWRVIVDEFLKKAEQLPGFVLISAGEKFGALHLRYACDDIAAVAALDNEATRRSVLTCEYCGRPGQLLRTGWHKTVCHLHSQRGQRP